MGIGYGVVVFLYGILFGSFYNVVIYRVPIDIPVYRGRSFCPKCKTQLKAIDLVPVFSQLFLGNKCRYCKSKISMRYPVIELATGLLFLTAYLLYGLSWELLLYVALWSMLLITALIDLDHMIVSDGILIAFSLLAVAYIVITGASWREHLLGAAVGFGLFLLIYLIAKAIYKQEAFGFGDVLLLGAVGLFLGIRNTIITCVFSFYIAFIVIIIMKIVGRKVTKELEIPFAPYICLAAFIASVCGDLITEKYLSLFV